MHSIYICVLRSLRPGILEEESFRGMQQNSLGKRKAVVYSGYNIATLELQLLTITTLIKSRNENFVGKTLFYWYKKWHGTQSLTIDVIYCRIFENSPAREPANISRQNFPTKLSKENLSDKKSIFIQSEIYNLCSMDSNDDFAPHWKSFFSYWIKPYQRLKTRLLKTSETG